MAPGDEKTIKNMIFFWPPKLEFFSNHPPHESKRGPLILSQGKRGEASFKIRQP